MKKLLSVVLSATLIWTSGSLAQAVASAPDVFVAPSALPQFQLIPPARLGRVVDYYNAAPEIAGHSVEGRAGTRPAPTMPLVILIQDLHAHYGVQKNIAGLLEFLSQKLRASPSPLAGEGARRADEGSPHPGFAHLLPQGEKEKQVIPFALAIEGSSGPVDSSVMALFPDEKIKLAASDYLMRQGELTGAEYFAIQRGLPDLLMGAENESYYKAHRELFRKTLSDRQDLVKTLQTLQGDLASLPRRTYSFPVYKIQKKVDAFDRGELGFPEFLGDLLTQTQSLNLKHDFPALAAFTVNSRLARAMTPQALNQATAQFLQAAQNTLSPEEKKNLQVLAKAQSRTPYYLYLRERVYQHNLFLAVPPELAQYLEFVHTAQTGLDRVQHEARELAYRIQMRLAKTQAEKDLLQVKHDLGLLLQVADLQATEIAVREFGPRMNQFVALAKGLVSAYRGDGASAFDEMKVRRLISSSIDYYVLAMLRNKPMVDNTLALIEEKANGGRQERRLTETAADRNGGDRNSFKKPITRRPFRQPPLPSAAAPVSRPSTAVLVAGGFHTASMTQILRDKHISYLVITPAVDKLTEADHELYIKRLNGQLATEDEILAAARTQAGSRAFRNAVPFLAKLLRHTDEKDSLAIGLEGIQLVPSFLTWFFGTLIPAGQIDAASGEAALRGHPTMKAWWDREKARRPQLTLFLANRRHNSSESAGKRVFAASQKAAGSDASARWSLKDFLVSILRLPGWALSAFQRAPRLVKVLGLGLLTQAPAFADYFYYTVKGQLMVHVGDWVSGSAGGTHSGLGAWIQNALRATQHLTRAQAKWDPQSLVDVSRHHVSAPSHLPPGDYAVNHLAQNAQNWLTQHAPMPSPAAPTLPDITIKIDHLSGYQPGHFPIPHLSNPVPWWNTPTAHGIEIVLVLGALTWVTYHYIWPRWKAWRAARTAERHRLLMKELADSETELEEAKNILQRARKEFYLHWEMNFYNARDAFETALLQNITPDAAGFQKAFQKYIQAAEELDHLSAGIIQYAQHREQVYDQALAGGVTPALPRDWHAQYLEAEASLRVNERWITASNKDIAKILTGPSPSTTELEKLSIYISQLAGVRLDELAQVNKYSLLAHAHNPVPPPAPYATLIGQMQINEQNRKQIRAAIAEQARQAEEDRRWAAAAAWAGVIAALPFLDILLKLQELEEQAEIEKENARIAQEVAGRVAEEKRQASRQAILDEIAREEAQREAEAQKKLKDRTRRRQDNRIARQTKPTKAQRTAVLNKIQTDAQERRQARADARERNRQSAGEHAHETLQTIFARQDARREQATKEATAATLKAGEAFADREAAVDALEFQQRQRENDLAQTLGEAAKTAVTLVLQPDRLIQIQLSPAAPPPVVEAPLPITPEPAQPAPAQPLAAPEPVAVSPAAPHTPALPAPAAAAPSVETAPEQPQVPESHTYTPKEVVASDELYLVYVIPIDGGQAAAALEKGWELTTPKNGLDPLGVSAPKVIKQAVEKFNAIDEDLAVLVIAIPRKDLKPFQEVPFHTQLTNLFGQKRSSYKIPSFLPLSMKKTITDLTGSMVLVIPPGYLRGYFPPRPNMKADRDTFVESSHWVAAPAAAPAVVPPPQAPVIAVPSPADVAEAAWHEEIQKTRASLDQEEALLHELATRNDEAALGDLRNRLRAQEDAIYELHDLALTRRHQNLLREADGKYEAATEASERQSSMAYGHHNKTGAKKGTELEDMHDEAVKQHEQERQRLTAQTQAQTQNEIDAYEKALDAKLAAITKEEERRKRHDALRDQLKTILELAAGRINHALDGVPMGTPHEQRQKMIVLAANAAKSQIEALLAGIPKDEVWQDSGLIFREPLTFLRREIVGLQTLDRMQKAQSMVRVQELNAALLNLQGLAAEIVRVQPSAQGMLNEIKFDQTVQRGIKGLEKKSVGLENQEAERRAQERAQIERAQLKTELATLEAAVAAETASGLTRQSLKSLTDRFSSLEPSASASSPENQTALTRIGEAITNLKYALAIRESIQKEAAKISAESQSADFESAWKTLDHFNALAESFAVNLFLKEFLNDARRAIILAGITRAQNGLTQAADNRALTTKMVNAARNRFRAMSERARGANIVDEGLRAAFFAASELVNRSAVQAGFLELAVAVEDSITPPADPHANWQIPSNETLLNWWNQHAAITANANGYVGQFAGIKDAYERAAAAIRKAEDQRRAKEKVIRDIQAHNDFIAKLNQGPDRLTQEKLVNVDEGYKSLIAEAGIFSEDADVRPLLNTTDLIGQGLHIWVGLGLLADQLAKAGISGEDLQRIENEARALINQPAYLKIKEGNIVAGLEQAALALIKQLMEIKEKPAASQPPRIAPPSRGILPEDQAMAQMKEFAAVIKKDFERHGHVIDLPSDKELIFVGDQHARLDNLIKILNTNDNMNKIRQGKAILVLMGDAIHSEDPNQLAEMDSSVEIMQYIMDLKIQNPANVYMMLGNHDFTNNGAAKGVRGGPPVFQSALYTMKLMELYPTKTPKSQNIYLSLYTQFIEMSPLMATSKGILAIHAGPPEIKSLDEIRNVKVEDRRTTEQESIVAQATWRRYKKTPSSDPEDFEYNENDVTKFRAAAGQPNAIVLVGHSPQLIPNGGFHHELLPGHHIVFAGRPRTGYASYVNGKLEFVEATQSSDQPGPPLPPAPSPTPTARKNDHGERTYAQLTGIEMLAPIYRAEFWKALRVGALPTAERLLAQLESMPSPDAAELGHMRSELKKAHESGGLRSTEIGGPGQPAYFEKVVLDPFWMTFDGSDLRFRVSVASGRVELQVLDRSGQEVAASHGLFDLGKPFPVNGAQVVVNKENGYLFVSVKAGSVPGKKYTIYWKPAEINREGMPTELSNSMVDTLVNKFFTAEKPAIDPDQSAGSDTVMNWVGSKEPKEMIKRIKKAILARDGKSAVDIQLKQKGGVRRFTVRSLIQAVKLRSKDDPQRYKDIFRTVSIALDLLFNGEAKQEQIINSELDFLKSPVLTSAVPEVYHGFIDATPSQVLGKDVVALPQDVQNFFLENNMERLKAYLDSDMVRDVFNRLGAKDGEVNLAQFLGDYLQTVYEFEKASTGDQLRVALAKLLKLKSYKFFKAFVYGRLKLYSRVKNAFLIDESRPIGTMDPDKIELVKAENPEAFMAFVREKTKPIEGNVQALNELPTYIFNTFYEWDNRLFALAARGGRLELYYTSDTYSRVAGQYQWQRQEAVRATITPAGRLHIGWFAKPTVEHAHELSDRASTRINELLARAAPLRQAFMINLDDPADPYKTPELLANLHLDLGLAFNYDGVMMSRAADGDTLGIEVDRTRYRGWFGDEEKLDELPLPRQLKKFSEARVLPFNILEKLTNLKVAAALFAAYIGFHMAVIVAPAAEVGKTLLSPEKVVHAATQAASMGDQAASAAIVFLACLAAGVVWNKAHDAWNQWRRRANLAPSVLRNIIGKMSGAGSSGLQNFVDPDLAINNPELQAERKSLITTYA